MKPDDAEGTPLGEYTRIRANIQLGDGPDQRGDVTVEIVREPGEDRAERSVVMPEAATGESPVMDVTAPMNDRDFAEFYHELMRARKALNQALGLPEDDNE